MTTKRSVALNDELFSCDRAANDRISVIICRLQTESLDISLDMCSLAMDLTVCHNLGHVDLKRLATSGIDTLIHDVEGISKYLDRDTGELTRCFLPRCHAVAEEHCHA